MTGHGTGCTGTVRLPAPLVVFFMIPGEVWAYIVDDDADEILKMKATRIDTTMLRLKSMQLELVLSA